MRNIVSGVGSQQMMSSDEYQPIGIIEPRRTMKVSEEFREILNLHRLLEGAGIPHLFRECYDGFTIRYPNVGRSECFVTERRFNIGYQKRQLDICGLLTKEETEADTGTRMAMAYFLTSEDVFDRIRKHYLTQGISVTEAHGPLKSDE